MKCPVCQAKLLPVDGEMFCLQCGNTVAADASDDMTGPALDETTDPLLQRAIVDSLGHDLAFRSPVAAAAPQVKTNTFTSMRSILAPPHPLVATAVGAGNATMSVAGSRNVGVASKPDDALTVAVVPKLGVANLNLLPVRPERAAGGWKWPKLSLAWVVGVAAFAVFLVFNATLAWYYGDRVYPGVRVGGLAVGGLPLGSLHAKLVMAFGQPTLVAQVGAAKYPLDTTGLGTAQVDQMERLAKEVGRSTPLPLAGVLESLISAPIPVSQQLDARVLNRLAQTLSDELTYRPSDAVPMIVAGQAIVIADKPGLQLGVSQAAAAISAAYGADPSFDVRPKTLEPVITASAFADDLSAAQAKLGLNLKVKLRGKTYSPTPSQIGSWLSFAGPGKGVSANPAALAAYIGALPGSFDRVSAIGALMAAVNDTRDLTYTAITRKITGQPKVANTAPALPLQSYHYCTRGVSGSQTRTLIERAAATLGGASGWGLNGLVAFGSGEADCNFSLELRSTAQMADVGTVCKGLVSCQVGNVLAFNADKWDTLPVGWVGSLAGYQTELINHEVGHWLGFDHAGCVSKPTAQPILATPTVVLPGCSPNWYQVASGGTSTRLLEPF